MTEQNAFAGYSRDDPLRAINNMRQEAEEYGDITRIKFEEHFDRLLANLDNTDTDEQAQRTVTESFPPDALAQVFFDTLENMFASHGARLEDYNTLLITHDIIRDRLT